MSEEKKLYSPKDVAQMFGISTSALRGRRIRGQIEGTVIDKNTIVYTEDQIKKANLKQRKRGPKAREKAEKQPDAA
jgi:predicted site-specific integrase-resolvase